MDPQKKKTILVAILGSVLLGVGAFQFIGGGEEKKPEKKDKAKAEAKSEGGATTSGDATKELKDLVANSQISEDNPAGLVYSIPLSQRDPFAQRGVTLEKPANADPPKTTQSQPAQPAPPPIGNRNPGSWVPPVFPSGPGGEGLPPGPIDTQPGTPMRQPGEFAFVPVGVIDGAHPAVVFQDDSGNQVLVPLGGSVGPNSVVTKIENNKITVRHNKKNLSFTVGGTPNAK